MESDGTADASPRSFYLVGASAWIFGCAAYYYARFTWAFLGQYGESIRELGSQVAGVFALSGGAR